MNRIFLLLIILLSFTTETFAYAIKVYDEYGNRVGTYRKEGDKYQLYDFNDKKVETPDGLTHGNPKTKVMSENYQILYDENMIPIGRWEPVIYGSNGRYYPLGGIFYPVPYNDYSGNYIVKPDSNIYSQNQKPNSTNIIDTRFPKFHKF